MGIRGEVFSTRVILQNRTYFFNVKENRLGDLYLNIVESKNRDEGGFERQSVILFAEDLQEFLQGFDESLKVLEKSVREKRKGKPSTARSKSRDDDYSPGDSGRTGSDRRSSDRNGTGRSDSPRAGRSPRTGGTGNARTAGRSTAGRARSEGRATGGRAGPTGRAAGGSRSGGRDGRARFGDSGGAGRRESGTRTSNFDRGGSDRAFGTAGGFAGSRGAGSAGGRTRSEGATGGRARDSSRSKDSSRSRDSSGAGDFSRQGKRSDNKRAEKGQRNSERIASFSTKRKVIVRKK